MTFLVAQRRHQKNHPNLTTPTYIEYLDFCFFVFFFDWRFYFVITNKKFKRRTQWNFLFCVVNNSTCTTRVLQERIRNRNLMYIQVAIRDLADLDVPEIIELLQRYL